MSRRRAARETFEQLDRMARDLSDVQPMSDAMRQEWEAARQTGKRPGPGRPRKDPRLKSRIVPISIDPQLLARVDEFSKSAGVSRSKLVAEGLRLRMQVSRPADGTKMPAAKRTRRAG